MKESKLIFLVDSVKNISYKVLAIMQAVIFTTYGLVLMQHLV